MRLGFWQKLAIYGTTAMVGLSGLLWFILHDVVADDTGDWSHLLLVLHGASAYALLVAVGSLLPLHVRAGWLRRRNLATGLMVIAVMAVLGITALMLYYGSEEWQMAAKWLHLIIGLAGFVLFPAHTFMRLTTRDQTNARAEERFATAGRQAAPAISADKGSA
ncbi:MAG: hypothetical protein KGL62_16715 [Bradyrhizobium sp.]|uniref:hypothetical protein n=1 Tax=Bradyrhizobium sp. TaxID=376 RepID=UPI00238A7A09|nr:hypothetical protein [Bradyrhizobium sp.]MDE2603990.1 hypothetical protein [Bradyrhizobium sp.]